MGAKAVGLYSNSGTISNAGGTLNVATDAIGIFAEKNATSIDVGNTTVTEGVGVVLKDLVSPPAITGAITLNGGTAASGSSTPAKYSIGTFLVNASGTLTALPAISHLGDYTVTMVIEDIDPDPPSPPVITPALSVNVPLTVGSSGFTNEIGAIVKNKDVSVAFNNPVTITGQENIGIYSENSVVTYNTITVTDLPVTDTNYQASSIGAYAIGKSITGGALTVGKNNIGIFGDEAVIKTGNITANDRAIGVYSKGDAGASPLKKVETGNIEAKTAAYGVFGTDSDIDVKGSIKVGTDTAIGVISEGKGAIDIEGDITVASKANLADLNHPASIGIYKKKGEGNITTAAGKLMDIGKGGYGYYVDNSGGSNVIDIYGNADIALKEAAVGGYISGKANYIGNSNITVGESYLGANPPSDHRVQSDTLNSIGLYIADGATGTNYGNIDVSYDHSVGVYLREAKFENAGTFLVDNGAVGILAKEGTYVKNSGTIDVKMTTTPSCGGKSIGIAAYGVDNNIAVVENTGTVNVYDGIGIYLNPYSQLINTGAIHVDDGDGLYIAPGAILDNRGILDLTDFDGDRINGNKEVSAGDMPWGAVNITDDGVVVINNDFIHAGTLMAENVIANGAIVKITGIDPDKPMFEVNNLEGTVKLESDFIKTGNGYGWTVPNFYKTLSGGAATTKVTIETSPLFVAHVTQNGSLTVAKQPYAYLVTGTQFEKLYDGVDSLLALDQAGLGDDSQILKGLNAYLDAKYEESEDEFMKEADRTLAEMRGDIYATIQDRMQDVNRAFDRSFEELLNSYNYTRDTGKWSVIYQQGRFRDDTVGIDSYDYRVQGVLYMKEYEGRRYNNKWGWYAGFAVSRFDFDDAPKYFDRSKEDIYSVRVGAHFVKSIGENDRLRWISRVELGYNRHDAERVLELDKVYKNSAHYDSFTVSFDNKLEKTLYRSLSTNINAYAGVNLEYGHISKFTEHSGHNADGTPTGGLELDVKGRDYYSIAAEIGVKGSKRFYVGKKVSLKLEGDVAYGYEFGSNHKANRGRVHGGTEDYYDLIKPAEEKGVGRARASLTIEKRDHIGLSFDVEARKYQNKKDVDLRYGVRFTYKF
jgi:hypothetical protein